MKILAIETSCDETALAVLEVSGSKTKPTFRILSHNVASQIELHAQYGGVFPMMAKREHAKNLLPLFIKTMKEAGFSSSKVKSPKSKESQIAKLKKILEREPELLAQLLSALPKLTKPAIDAICVTVGPGLEPTLWVGINFARALSYIWDIPIVPVNHMEGHVLSIFPQKNQKQFKVESLKFPVISLLVSGGHTEIVLVKGIGKYKVVGRTRDDAAGEAFDKVARMLDLPYPGGPEISKLAEIARNEKLIISSEKIKLPRPMLYTKDFDFSFSGLKTAVLYLIRDLKKLTENDKKAIAREFENAVVEVLVKKTMKALTKYKARSLIVGGGVAANKHLRSELTGMCKKEKIDVVFPTRELSTDNAVMIGIAGTLSYLRTKKGARYDSKRLVADGNLSF